MAATGSRKWWVFGCLGLFGLGVLAVATIAALAFLAARSERIVHPLIERDVPAHSGETDEVPGPAGRVIVEAAVGEIYVEPGAPGEPLSVEGSYDANYYRLDESLEEGRPWTYRASLVSTRSTLMLVIKELVAGNPRVRVRLPPGTPLELELRIRNGTASVDLGGLWLSEAAFDLRGGVLDLGASEPMTGRPERVTIRGSRGGLFLTALSKIGPRELEIDFSMGSAQLDMRGPWPQDAGIDLHTEMSDVVIRLPRDARVEGLDEVESPTVAEEELAPPTLRFEVSTGMRGNLKVFR